MAVTFGSNFVKGKVVSVKKDAKKVVLEDGTEIEYSDLILATGSTGPFPGRSHADTAAKLKEEYTHLREEVRLLNESSLECCMSLYLNKPCSVVVTN
jgi:NADH dehydrogenase FAD-containing subunit